MYLNWFLIDFVGPPTELIQSCIGILSVNHNNIGTTPRRNHLDKEEKVIVKYRIGSASDHKDL